MRVAVAASAATAVTAVLVGRQWLSARPLGAVMEEGDPFTIADDHAYYNQRYEFGHGPFRTDGHDPVRLTAARLVNPTPGLTVEDIRAINTCDGGSETVYGAVGTVLDSFPKMKTHPITDAVIGPAERRCWYVMVGVHVSKPGTYGTDGIELTYVRGDRTGRQRLPYKFQLTAEKPGPDPRDKTPDAAR